MHYIDCNFTFFLGNEKTSGDITHPFIDAETVLSFPQSGNKSGMKIGACHPELVLVSIIRIFFYFF
jgi:hypothetical protein